jgi:predicted RNase H-like nuclease
LADVDLVVDARPLGSVPAADALIASAAILGLVEPDIVAIDMPLSMQPITCRRTADNAISRTYGGRKCSTHTPSAERPGKISDDLCVGFGASGYPLAMTTISAPCLIEVYPHPALVELTLAAERLPYKMSKVAKYWPDLTPPGRRLKLFDQWVAIVAALDAVVMGVADSLPLPSPSAPGHALKAFEDMLDAVVCAWIGAEALDGGAVAYGDEHAAIWVPRPR